MDNQKNISVIILLLNRNYLNNAIFNINWDNNVVAKAVVMDAETSTYVTFDDKRIPLIPYGRIEETFPIDDDKTLWLIYGYQRDVAEAWKMAKFLIAYGVKRERIINFSMDIFLNRKWIGNLRWAENNSLDFFATGISYTEVGLELSCLRGLKGVNLACSSADLRNNLATAKHVFKHHPAGSCKFVIIGLAPYSFHFDNRQAFSISPRDVQFSLALNSWDDSCPVLPSLLSTSLQRGVDSITEKEADLDFDSVKRQEGISAEEIISWEAEIRNQDKRFLPNVFGANVQILEEYIDLCHAHGAFPVVVVWPFAPIIRKQYPQEVMSLFKQALGQMMKYKHFLLLDLSSMQLSYDCFYKLSHLNRKGAEIASRLVNYWLCRKGVIPFENLCKMSYQELQSLRVWIGKDDYAHTLEKIFRLTEKRLAQKEKINVGFILYDASMWCGDELYQFFEQHPRYEPVVYMGLRTDTKDVNAVRTDFEKGIEGFRSKGINVIGVEDSFASDINMDIAFCLTPYNYVLPMKLKFMAMKADTLLVSIPYGLELTNIIDMAPVQPIEYVAWKKFVESEATMEWNREHGADRYRLSEVSGHPKMDVFYKRKNSGNHKWKQVRDDAKKIIWAPHWSIAAGVFYATFQYNYEFFYQYAKSHPETSWIVKPHPNLLFSAVENKVFSSESDFREYLEKWNDLPNACVETGAYYQDMFITSDAMILDSASFTLEYQYTGKPLLFLTRETQKFNEIGDALMQVLYRSDGRNFADIERFIEKVVVKGDDTMREARESFFCSNLDYVKNGKTASQYIFNRINQAIDIQC